MLLLILLLLLMVVAVTIIFTALRKLVQLLHYDALECYGSCSLTLTCNLQLDCGVSSFVGPCRRKCCWLLPKDTVYPQVDLRQNPFNSTCSISVENYSISSGITLFYSGNTFVSYFSVHNEHAKLNKMWRSLPDLAEAIRTKPSFALELLMISLLSL